MSTGVQPEGKVQPSPESAIDEKTVWKLSCNKKAQFPYLHLDM